MTRRAKTNLTLMFVAFSLGLAGTLILLREPMARLTQSGLEEAGERWREAGVTDYDLTYRMHGSLYAVVVRGGIVTKITMNGEPARTADPAAYSVDGLLETLELDLENLSNPAGPFAGQAQTMLMRVRFNAELGYVERYLRSGGAGRGASIELLEFQPVRR